LSRDLGDFVAEGGAVVGGSAALGVVAGFIIGSIVHDFRPDKDPDAWARAGGFWGGVVGFGLLLARV
jgi:hypothetical protein